MNEDGVVQFDPEEFKTLYPEFSNTSDGVLENYFNAACLLLNNTKNSLVTDLNERKTLLYLLVCHIATLKSAGNKTVGILTGATEGKVSTSFTPLNNANWYQLTQCGNLYWNATAKYRRGIRYYEGC